MPPVPMPLLPGRLISRKLRRTKGLSLSDYVSGKAE